MDSFLKAGSHLIIRTKDINCRGLTHSPALDIWKIPVDIFDIREIIVVTENDQSDESEEISDLKISHEWVLVYQKP